MAQDGSISDKAAPPFATRAGEPAGGSSSQQATGGRDFTKDYEGQKGTASGGRDFTKESRPQSEADPMPEPPNDEVPKGDGGKQLTAQPGAVTGGKLGGVDALGSTSSPFKNLR